METKATDKVVYVPNYKGNRLACSQSPTVVVEVNGVEVRDIDLCGPCTFGAAAAIDVAWWNGD